MINYGIDLWEFIITWKFNSFEISSTQSAKESVRENILNAKIVLKCYSLWGSKAGPEHCPIFAHFALQLHSAMLAKSGIFFLNYQILDLLVVKQYKIH